MNGYVPHRQRKENAKHIGVVFGQRSHLWFDLPVQESFELLQRIYRIPEAQYRHNVEVFDELLNLGDFFPDACPSIKSRSTDACGHRCCIAPQSGCLVS